MQAVNLGLRFLLELCALIIYGYWGYQVGTGKIHKWGLGICTPLGVAIVWAIFGSPKAPLPLSAIYSLIFPKVAAAYGVGVIINKTLMYIWNQ